MMNTFADVSAPNSLVLVMDQSVGIIPETMGGALAVATASCLAIATQSEHDGATRITLTDQAGERDGGLWAFDGVLETPSGTLAVCTVLDDVILVAQVPTKATRVRVWANDRSEPDDILIVLGDSAGSD